VAQRAFPISKKQEKAITPSGNSSEGENVDEIQSLTQRVSDLGQAVDFWNVVMLWGLALAAAAAISVGRLSLVGRPNITCVPKIRHTATKASPKNQIRTLPKFSHFATESS
jgi:hypothetical protein